MAAPAWFWEPALITFLLLGGTIANRRRKNRHSCQRFKCARENQSRCDLEDGLSAPEEENFSHDEDGVAPTITFSTISLISESDCPKWRMRSVGVFGWTRNVLTPNTRQYCGYFMSRILYRYLFLIEAGYWFLIYWVCQFFRQ